MVDTEYRVGGSEPAAIDVAGRSLEGRTTGRVDTPSVVPLEGGRSVTVSRLRAGADA